MERETRKILDSKDFKVLRAGRLVRAVGGYDAFMPAPQPPALEYDDAFVRLLSEADAGLSELSGMARLLPNPRLLIAPFIRREAVYSSRIEGTQTNLAQLLLDEVAPGADSRIPEDVKEVRNYVVALEHGVARLASLPLSLRLVRELHDRLMRDVRGDRARPGEFRRIQNWIGPARTPIEQAIYVPPPPEALDEALSAWEKFLHERDRLPDIIQCGLMHEHFEAIHPFHDGNGRVGRLLIVLFLVERGRLSHPILYLSDYIDARRLEYYDALQRIRTHGDWMGWLAFFLTGVRDTARVGVAQAHRIIKLRATLLARFREQPRLIALLEHLFHNPYVTVSRAAELLKVTAPTARSLLATLQRQRMLKEVTGRSWGRIYLAEPILAAIENAPEDRASAGADVDPRPPQRGG